MNPISRRRVAWLAALTGLWLVWALATLPAVPFHPDESTYLYMSADAAAVLHHPLALAYSGQGGLREHYRLVNAPLTRYLTALGLALHGQSPLRADWDWSVSWQANVAAGALPSARQLLAARRVMTVCTALAGLLLALVALRLGGLAAALFTLGGFLLNPLVLLHGRRVMMEAPMLLGMAWLLWEVTAERPQPWRVGAALAWAVWAKYWALAWAPVALWAVWRAEPLPFKRRVLRLLPVVLVPAVTGFLLQPVLWRHPAATLAAMWTARWAVTARQQAAFRAVLPAYAPATPWQRLALLLGHLYLAPPAYLDLGKYRAPLAAAIAAYDGHVWMHWTRPLAVAAARLVAMLAGLVVMARLAWRGREAPRRWAARVVLLAAAFQWSFLLLTLPLAFQRYALAVLPFTTIWEALALASFFHLLAPNSLIPNS